MSIMVIVGCDSLGSGPGPHLLFGCSWVNKIGNVNNGQKWENKKERNTLVDILWACWKLEFPIQLKQIASVKIKQEIWSLRLLLKNVWCINSSNKQKHNIGDNYCFDIKPRFHGWHHRRDREWICILAGVNKRKWLRIWGTAGSPRQMQIN